MEQEEQRVTAVIIDTSAFLQADFDFMGLKSARLVSLFDLIKDKNILLLTHPILEKEVEKHITDSSIFKEYESLVCDLKRTEDIILKLNLCNDDIIQTITDYNIRNYIIDSFHSHYKNSQTLGYTNPERVFEMYFSGEPPFSLTGKKKNEFPDAFIIQSVKQFLNEHENDVLMVISADNDWKNALFNTERVVFCNSINEGTDYINHTDGILNAEIIEAIYRNTYDEIINAAQSELINEDFYFPDYEFSYGPDIDSITVETINNYDVLSISRKELLIGANIQLKVSGYGEIIDESNSCWDSEERDYLFVSYADMGFQDGTSDVDCEIRISYDFDDPIESSNVDSIRIINYTPIEIKCDKVLIEPISDEELANRVLREDKGLSRT